MEYSWQQILLFWGILIGVAMIYVMIRERINLKKAATGEDRERIVGIFKKLLPDTWGSYHIAYASWEKKEYHGKRTTTHYWYYAIAFSWEELYVVPLLCENKEIRYKDSFCVTPNSIGTIEGKDGENWMTLYDRTGKKILTLAVNAKNTKSDRYHPVNIVQEEEAAAFAALIEHWRNTIHGMDSN